VYAKIFIPNICRRKKEAREAHTRSEYAQRVHGLRAKLYNKQRFQEKAEMRKTYELDLPVTND